MTDSPRDAQSADAGLAGASKEVARFDAAGRGPLQTFQHALHANPTLAPLIVLALSIAVFGVFANNFFTPFNLSLIAQQVSVIGILAAAQTLVILTAGIDLSVAAIMALSFMVMARLGVDGGLPSLLALAGGLAVGLACGALNGMLTTRLRIVPIVALTVVWVVAVQFGAAAFGAEPALVYGVPLGFAAALAFGFLVARPSIDLRLPPFIATLGAWSIFYALTLWYSTAQTVRGPDIEASAPLLRDLGERISLGGFQITYGVLVMLLVFAALWYLLNWTAWGRAVYAIGDDKSAAELSGIDTDRTLLSVYALAGLICGLAGWVAIGRVGSASPQSFYEGNLDAITAVVIGGTSLFGGRGAIFGALIGALIVGVFRSGLKLSGFEPLWENFAVGLLIIVAVAMDQWIRKVSA